MATLLIEPVQTTTRGGHAAEITGIDPTSNNCLSGTVDTANGKQKQVWNLDGTASNNGDSVNLDKNDDEVADVIDLARKLGAS